MVWLPPYNFVHTIPAWHNREFSFPLKSQTDSDEYDVKRLNVHEYKKFILAKMLTYESNVKLFYMHKLHKTHFWPTEIYT